MQFCTVDAANRGGEETIDSSGDQDLTVGQQRGRVPEADRVEAPGAPPGPGGWIVQLLAIQRRACIVVAPTDQHLAIRDQWRCWTMTRPEKAASEAPTRTRRLCRGSPRSIRRQDDPTQQTGQSQDQAH